MPTAAALMLLLSAAPASSLRSLMRPVQTPRTSAMRTQTPALVLSDQPPKRGQQLLEVLPSLPQRASPFGTPANAIRNTARTSNDSPRTKSVIGKLRNAWTTYCAASSDKLWRSVFSECDADGDGSVDRRELLVLLYRLGVEIPSAATLKSLFQKYDIDVRIANQTPMSMVAPVSRMPPARAHACVCARARIIPSQEDGGLDFAEFSELVRDLDSAVNKPVWREDSARTATRKWLTEKRQITLWRTLFDRLDSLPRDGFLQNNEVAAAMRLADIPVTDEQVRRASSRTSPLRLLPRLPTWNPCS